MKELSITEIAWLRPMGEYRWAFYAVPVETYRAWLAQSCRVSVVMQIDDLNDNDASRSFYY